MNASLPAVRLMEDGSMVMDCRKIALFTHLKYPRYLARLRQKLDENPRCWKFFPGLPHPIPLKKSLEEYTIWSTWSGVELMFHDGAARRALLKAFTAGPGAATASAEEPIQADPEAPEPDENGSSKSTAGDEKFLIVRPAADGGEPMADSRDVAKYFGKSHKNVLQAYRNLGCSLGFLRLNFQPCYINGLDGDLSHVLMTKIGFAFLALGFTGEKADLFKEAFIGKYDSMERRQEAGSAGRPNWNDPAAMRQMLIEATYKIEEANSRADAARAETVDAKQETEEERKLRIAAEAKAAAETERAMQQQDLAGRERVAREAAESKTAALRKAFSEIADDEHLMLPSDAATNFHYGLQTFMDWMEAGGWFKWRRSGKNKIGPAIATEDAIRKGIAINQFRPYSVAEKRDEAGSVIRAAKKKMTTQAYITMDGYLWLHHALPDPQTLPQGKLPIGTPPSPTKH